MKLKIIILALTTTAIMVSCNQETKTQNVENENPTTANNQTYLHTKNRDTTLLTLEIGENSISGKLDILLYEKDSRRGEIVDGHLKGDTLFAIYKSMQEGLESESEIAFLKKVASYIMTNDIFGERNYQYNSDYTKGSFKNKNTIKFDGNTLKLTRNN